MRGVSLWLLLYIAIPVNLYPLLYAWRPWWVTPAGRALMLKAIGNVVLVDLIAAAALFGDYDGREQIRTVGMVIFGTGVWYLLFVLWRTPQEPPRHQHPHR